MSSVFSVGLRVGMDYPRGPTDMFLFVPGGQTVLKCFLPSQRHLRSQSQLAETPAAVGLFRQSTCPGCISATGVDAGEIDWLKPDAG